MRLSFVCLGRVLRILLSFWTILCYDNLSVKWCRFKVDFEVNYFDHVTIIVFVYHLIAGFRYYRNESPKSNPTISCDLLPLILLSRTTTSQPTIPVLEKSTKLLNLLGFPNTLFFCSLVTFMDILDLVVMLQVKDNLADYKV